MWLFLVSIGVVTFLLHLIYKRLTTSHKNYWKQYGVLQVDASSAATNMEVLMGKKDVTLRDVFAYAVLETTGDKYCGLIENSNKVLVVKDLELIKKILIKDFEHFPQRRDFFDFTPESSIIRKMMALAKGDDWRDLRNTLSPTFTTGKIRKMMQSFNTVGKEWSTALKSRSKNGSLTVDALKCVNQYTIDVIAATVFGIYAGSVKDPDSEFSRMAIRFANFNMYKMTIGLQFPWLFRKMGIEVIDEEATHWFEKILDQGLQQRLKGGPKQNDFLQLLADAKKGELKTAQEDELNEFEKEAQGHFKTTGKKVLLSDDILNAQSLMFFLAGFSTVTNFLTFALYAMATHPEVQERLREEVDKIVKGSGDFDYDELSQLPFMEMFVCEVLRWFPAALRLERVCMKEYKDPETGLFVPKGTLIAIPVRSMHNDPKYFDSPDKFDPEANFSPEKKHGRSHYVYLPFGSGPRNCIGMRFALMEGKAGIAHIVHSFKIEPTENTPMPMKGVEASIQVVPPKGLEVKLSPRRS